MGDSKGFMKIRRQQSQKRPVKERLKDHKEIPVIKSVEESQEQAARCMDCGTPFCHAMCPVGSLIPEWNDLMYKGRWKEALDLLLSWNSFPEITGRICPALCEAACVLGINDEPVTCRENELAIIEYAFKKRWIKPRKKHKATGKKVAIVGSGPAGLAAADVLNILGHKVIVFEKDDALGGMLRYGIPDFKLDKKLIDRRIRIFVKEGISFKTSTAVGTDYSTEKLKKGFDAICLTGGVRVPRDLPIKGRDLGGVHFAMDYLMQMNRRNAGKKIKEPVIDAKGKRVVVIGGGDTGSDCVGTAHRQGARQVTQIELLPQPPEERTPDMPWPTYPKLFKTSTSHEEGGDRFWNVLTNKFVGKNGVVEKLSCVKVTWGPEKDERGYPVMKEGPGSEFELAVDLVFLSMGFVAPEKHGLLEGLNLKFTDRGLVYTDVHYQTSKKGVFAAGDMRRGASLVVWALCEGRDMARYVDAFLKKNPR